MHYGSTCVKCLNYTGRFCTSVIIVITIGLYSYLYHQKKTYVNRVKRRHVAVLKTKHYVVIKRSVQSICPICTCLCICTVICYIKHVAHVLNKSFITCGNVLIYASIPQCVLYKMQNMCYFETATTLSHKEMVKSKVKLFYSAPES